eukprot:7389187-Prymnesium_polylepis.1
MDSRSRRILVGFRTSSAHGTRSRFHVPCALMRHNAQVKSSGRRCAPVPGWGRRLSQTLTTDHAALS